MRNLKRLKLPTLILLGLITYSCQNQDDYVMGIQDPIAEVDTSKLIDFKGLPVSHRFSTPIEDLTTEHKNVISILKKYNKARNKAAKKKGLYYKGERTELPKAEIIVLAVNKIIEQFPYQEPEELAELDLQDDLINSLQKKLIEEEKTLSEEEKEQLFSDIVLAKKQDSIAIAGAKATYQAIATVKAAENTEMIKADFPSLSEEEIAKNIEIIDQYYTINLEHLTFEHIAKNEEELANKVANNEQKRANRSQKKSSGTEELLDEFIVSQCTYVKLVLHDPYYLTQYINFSYAYFKAGTYAALYADRRYGNMAASDTRKDAYRHMMWNAMLCQTYYTVSSKSRRVRFARLVTDARENDCKSPNAPDGKAMDIHNNAVGRKVWSDNCGYRKIFGWVVGLKKPSITFLSNEIKNVIESRSCFVVKKKRSDIFPNDQLEDTQTPAQVKEKIDSTDPNIPVYFMGEIVPTKYVTVKVFVGYGEYECDDGNKILNQQKSQKLPELKCERPIYKYETREIVSCYKL